MSEKRRDNKNRILKTGESQRKDLTYMYRYQDLYGKRRSVYAPTLDLLREKEKQIQKDLDNQTLFDGHRITTSEMCERYISQRPHLSTYYKNSMRCFTRRIQKSSIAHTMIADLRMSVAKKYMVDLRQEGLSYNTIRSIHAFLRGVFNMAVEDEVLARNPFQFRLLLVLGKKDKAVAGLTSEEQAELLKYISCDKCFSKRYNDIVVLLHTGLRVGELCALTKSDIDFERGIINVTKQLQRYTNGVIKIVPPKTDAGIRMIPMDDDVRSALENILRDRQSAKVAPIVDGVGGFIFLSKQGGVAKPQMYEALCRRIEKGFNDSHTMQIRLTPHVFRHTFCTNLVKGGIDAASLQYLMGHSNARVSLNVYTDKTFENAQTAYFRVIQSC